MYKVYTGEVVGNEFSRFAFVFPTVRKSTSSQSISARSNGQRHFGNQSNVFTTSAQQQVINIGG